MLCIGPGPGPKNVLAERVEDGARLVVPYAVWKHRMIHYSPHGVYSPGIHRDENREVSSMDSLVKILRVTVGATKNGKQYFDVACSDGVDRRCWNAGLAQRINTFANDQGMGPDVTLRYDVTQNGQYTNYSVKAVFGPGEVVTADVQPMGGQQGGGGGGNRGGGGKGGYPPEVTTRITKLAAYEYASTLIGGLYAGAGPDALPQAIEQMDAVAKHIYKQARAHEQGGTTTNVLPQGDAANVLPQGGQPPIQPVADTAQGVADFANQAIQGAVQVGAPVAQAQDAAAEAPDTVDWD